MLGDNKLIGSSSAKTYNSIVGLIRGKLVSKRRGVLNVSANLAYAVVYLVSGLLYDA